MDMLAGFMLSQISLFFKARAHFAHILTLIYSPRGIAHAHMLTGCAHDNNPPHGAPLNSIILLCSGIQYK